MGAFRQNPRRITNDFDLDNSELLLSIFESLVVLLLNKSPLRFANKALLLCITMDLLVAVRILVSVRTSNLVSKMG